jgi:hypothetical protein
VTFVTLVTLVILVTFVIRVTLMIHEQTSITGLPFGIFGNVTKVHEEMKKTTMTNKPTKNACQET